MIKDWKHKFVDTFSASLKSAKVVGIADVGRLPSKHMQVVRRGLRGKATVKMVKRTLLKKALENAGLERMTRYIAQQPVLIISDLDAFSLFREIKSLRRPAPAKPGMVNSTDIVVKKGGTGLPPGPAIGDLQNVGIPARIEKGQIVVSKEHVILKAGDAVTQEIANALAKLDMKPFELGLEVTAILDGGLLFEREVLDVDVNEVSSRFVTGFGQALALAKTTGYPVKEVLEVLFAEIALQAKSLALKLDWVSKETIKEIVSKANAYALSLEGKIGGV
jgi:large subunit ribosomal protein L10